MTDFVLIDLRSQANAVWRYVDGWTKQEILAWLSKRGTITTHPTHPDSYWFQSNLGIETCFRLTVDGEFHIYFGEFNFYKLCSSE
jgi:hypothetical protein